MPGADVSVVIPLFDAEGSIERCLRSVASQSLSVREVIVIDDASAVSFEAPRPLPELAGSPITVIRFPRNRGAAAARNAGVARAQGKYVAFLDADDAWLPEKIAVQYTLMEAGGWSLSGHGYAFLPLAAGQRCVALPPRSRAVARHEFIITNPFFTPTVMALRAGFKPFDESFRRADDYKAWLENFRGGRTFLIDQVMAHGFKQPIGEGGLTGSVTAMHRGFMRVLVSLRREGTVSSLFYLAATGTELCKLPLRFIRVVAKKVLR